MLGNKHLEQLGDRPAHRLPVFHVANCSLGNAKRIPHPPLRPIQDKPCLLKTCHDSDNKKLILAVNKQLICGGDKFLIMSTPGERLKKARIEAGYASAADAARAIGVKPAAYTHHENGTAGLSRNGERYAKFFRIPYEWLMTGRQFSAPSTPGVPIYGVVGAGGTAIPITEDEAAANHDELTLPSGPFVGALLVKGDSGLPQVDHGDWVLFDIRPHPPRAMLNKTCVIDTNDGRRLFKRIRASSTPTRWVLESNNAKTEESVEILAAYRFLGCIKSS